MNVNVKKIDLLANVAIIAVALLLCTVLVRRHFANGRGANATARPSAVVPAGTKLALPGVEWAGAEHTLVLALSTSCHFCSESAPFYRRLANALAGRADVRLVAALPEAVAEGKSYLEKQGVAVADVRQVSLDEIQVMGTPTLLLVDKSGRVVKSWVGKLSAERESEVAEAVGAGGAIREVGPDETVETIEPADLNRMIGSGIGSGKRVVVLDVRERQEFSQGHVPGAKNIPIDELDVRAVNELRATDFIVVCSDCTSCGGEGKSYKAEQVLKDQGFRQTSLLRGGLDGWRQAGLPTTAR